jgi:hypothetical protein
MAQFYHISMDNYINELTVAVSTFWTILQYYLKIFVELIPWNFILDDSLEYILIDGYYQITRCSESGETRQLLAAYSMWREGRM